MDIDTSASPDLLTVKMKVMTEDMTLLDYFAAQAMCDIMGKNKNTYFLESGGVEGVAHYSYKVAAAMIKERKKHINNDKKENS